MEVYSNMGAKNTENMTQASEKETQKASKMKMCIVSCLGWIFYSKKNKQKNKNKANILGCFNAEILRHQLYTL